jgi:hypothetical protein
MVKPESTPLRFLLFTGEDDFFPALFLSVSIAFRSVPAFFVAAAFCFMVVRMDIG